MYLLHDDVFYKMNEIYFKELVNSHMLIICKKIKYPSNNIVDLLDLYNIVNTQQLFEYIPNLYPWDWYPWLLIKETVNMTTSRIHHELRLLKLGYEYYNTHEIELNKCNDPTEPYNGFIISDLTNIIENCPRKKWLAIAYIGQWLIQNQSPSFMFELQHSNVVYAALVYIIDHPTILPTTIRTALFSCLTLNNVKQLQQTQPQRVDVPPPQQTQPIPQQQPQPIPQQQQTQPVVQQHQQINVPPPQQTQPIVQQQQTQPVVQQQPLTFPPRKKVFIDQYSSTDSSSSIAVSSDDDQDEMSHDNQISLEREEDSEEDKESEDEKFIDMESMSSIPSEKEDEMIEEGEADWTDSEKEVMDIESMKDHSPIEEGEIVDQSASLNPDDNIVVNTYISTIDENDFLDLLQKLESASNYLTNVTFVAGDLFIELVLAIQGNIRLIEQRLLKNEMLVVQFNGRWMQQIKEMSRYLELIRTLLRNDMDLSKIISCVVMIYNYAKQLLELSLERLSR